jgi:hypothetical protein
MPSLIGWMHGATQLGLRLDFYHDAGMAGKKGPLMNKRAWISSIFLAIAATASPAYAEDVMACEAQSVNFKRREYRCPLTANGQEQQIRFKADFSGSHDDTELSMNLSLDGLPVSCRKGSKTWLNGEDGNVSLECYFVLDGAAGTKRMLRAMVNVYHAEFVGIKLSAP